MSESSNSVIIHIGPTSKKAEAVHTWGKWSSSFTLYFFHREDICPKKKEKIEFLGHILLIEILLGKDI